MAVWSLKVLSIQMTGAVMTAWWIRDAGNTSGGEHGDNEFAGRRSCVNGLESFWTFAKRIQRCSSKCSENYLSANHDSETLHLALKLLLARRRPSMPSELTAVR